MYIFYVKSINLAFTYFYTYYLIDYIKSIIIYPYKILVQIPDILINVFNAYASMECLFYTSNCFFIIYNIFMKNLQVLHSKRILRSGTVVGSFKIDLHTVYDTPGTLHFLFS